MLAALSRLRLQADRRGGRRLELRQTCVTEGILHLREALEDGRRRRRARATLGSPARGAGVGALRSLVRADRVERDEHLVDRLARRHRRDPAALRRAKRAILPFGDELAEILAAGRHARLEE